MMMGYTIRMIAFFPHLLHHYMLQHNSIRLSLSNTEMKVYISRFSLSIKGDEESK